MDIPYLDLTFLLIFLLLIFLYSKKDNYLSWFLLLIYFIAYYICYIENKISIWPAFLAIVFTFSAFYTITTKQNVQVGNLIVTLFMIICLFILYYYVDNFYIDITAIILMTISFYISIVKNKVTNLNLIVLFTVLIIILTTLKILIKVNVKGNIKENFYTLFEPHYLDRKLYKQFPKDAMLSYNNNNYYTKPIDLSYVNNTDEYLVNILGKLVLSRTKMLNIHTTHTDNVKDLIILPSPMVKYYNNIEFIGNLSHRYMYCLSTIKSGIQFIQQLSGKKLGIPEYLLPIWSDISPYMFNVDNQPILFVKPKEQLAKDLKNHKIDAIFYCGRHGNKYISDIIKSTVSASFQLVPIVFNYGNKFIKENPAYSKKILKLTFEYMPSKYLPMGYGRIWNSNYMPDYWTYSYDVSLYCKNDFQKRFGYQLAKILVTARQLITREKTVNMFDYIYDTMTPADVAILIFPNKQIHKGAKEYFMKLGLISYCKDPACMGKIGKGKCLHCEAGRPQTSMQFNTEALARKITEQY